MKQSTVNSKQLTASKRSLIRVRPFLSVFICIAFFALIAARVGTIQSPIFGTSANFSYGTASTVPYLDASKNLVSSTVTATQLGYVDATSSIQDQLDGKAGITSVNAQTGTTYILVLGDANDIITMNNAAANTVTIPANSSVAFPVGTIIAIDQIGAGATTITGATGVTVNGTSAGSVTITAQYLGACIKKIATDTWIVQGGI